jgi:Uma2 family endonuclease
MSVSYPTVDEELAFTQEDLADLPDAFPPCVIREGKIGRADGLPLEWEEYDLLDEGFPATLTEDGELQMSPRPRPAHEDKVTNLFKLFDGFLSCQPGGKAYAGPELRIHPYRRTLVPDVMFFRNPKPEWKQQSATHIDQIPDLAVEIVSPSNTGKKWEDNLAFYREAAFPEFWLVQLDGSVEISRAEPKMSATYKPGELFSSPLFPGLAIDPAWITDYPDEIRRIEQFSPKIVVSPGLTKQKLTKKAHALAARIAEHFGETYLPAPTPQTKRQPSRRQSISPQPQPTHEPDPGPEHER